MSQTTWSSRPKSADMTYIYIDNKPVMGLTVGERRSLHPSWLGRNPTWGDVQEVLQGKTIGDVEHHYDRRSRCDGCIVNVYAWAEEYLDGDGITGRRFCSICTRFRRGMK
jgi:hypothetical protein